MPGNTIELRESHGDFRDYLDGQPIHNGDQLMLWTGDRWVWARYEVADFHQREVVLDTIEGERRVDRATMHVRWPTKQD